MSKMKDIFGIKSLGEYSSPTDGYKQRENLGIWVVDKETKLGGKYLGHVNDGSIIIRWDVSNQPQPQLLGGFHPSDGGFGFIAKKVFLKYCDIEYHKLAEEIISESCIFI